ncbi:peptidase inhibitor family I36 protein [Actinoplanes sp. NPDC049681]|uniref:peptidase inhibitor family I36 protein n=1 Tax=Actinoplanes sp. NPDC049681 TaxID=3363905 RepID=UPI0037AB6D52
MKMRFAIAGALTAIAVGGFLAPSAAHADTPAGSADGNFYAWNEWRYSGHKCAWQGNSADWTGAGCRNQASSVWNNGYLGGNDDVRMYWDTNYGGASICLWRGTYIENLQSVSFPNNGAGAGQNANDNISSHKWVSSC